MKRLAISTLVLSCLIPALSGLARAAPPSGEEFFPVGGIPATPEISPDGTMVVACFPGGLKLRRLNSVDWILLKGTEGASQPLWSADSSSIGFFASFTLRPLRRSS